IRIAFSFRRAAKAAYGLISKPKTLTPRKYASTRVVPTPANGSRTQRSVSCTGRYLVRQSSTKSAENPAIQGTQRCSGRDLFLAKEESRNPFVAGGAPKRVCCIDVNPNRE